MKKKKVWSQVGITFNKKDYVFSNGDQIVPVPIALVEQLRKDSYDLGVDTGKRIQQKLNENA